MKTTVTSRHFKASEKLNDYAKKEIERLNKYFDAIIDCDCVLSFDVNKNKTVEYSIRVPGEILHASETSDDFYKSIDQAVTKLEKQVVRFKDKLRKKH
jgi:putative sigma-54 modulation protein